jgi:glucose/arabinose dehydrogenase
MEMRKRFTRCALMFLLAIALTIGFANSSALAQKLYLSDYKDNSVKVVDLDLSNNSGEVKTLVASGSGDLDGPLGILFNGNSLLVANQNMFLNLAGEILSFDGTTGAFQGALVSSSDKDTPWLPRGIILGDNLNPNSPFLYVANLTTSQGKSTGTLSTYNVNGNFLGNLQAKGFPNNQFHPRGVVFGPDGRLYVSTRTLKKDGLGGWVLRFNPDGSFLDVFIADAGGLGHLNRPEGLVFGPDGQSLYHQFSR